MSLRIPAMALLAAALPMAGAHAANWQPYQTANAQVSEIDADSVHVADGLVHFSYRTRQARQSMVPDVFGHAIDAVVDCEGRRHSDVIKGRTDLREIYEETQAAFQLDLACRLAGRPFKSHADVAPPVVHEWVVYSDEYGMHQKIDARSVSKRDGLVFFQYLQQYGAQPGDVSDGVVDCAARKIANVVHGQFELAEIRDRTTVADRAAAACRLAKFPFAVHVADPDAD